MEKNEQVVDFGALSTESVEAAKESIERAKNGENIIAMNDRQRAKVFEDGFFNGTFWPGVALLGASFIVRYVMPAAEKGFKKLFDKKSK